MSRQPNTIRERDVVAWINISLAGTALLLLLYYIMMANSIASKNYKIYTLGDKLEMLAEANSLLMSKKLAMESQATLLEFIKSRSMVEARNVVYIFENKNVAQR